MPTEVGNAVQRPDDGTGAEHPRRPSASIVAIGFRVEAFVPNHEPVAHMIQQPQRDDVDDLVETVREQLDAGGHVIAIYPGWDPEPALGRLELVRMALGSTGVALYRTDLPPLAGAVLASLAAAVGAHVGSAGLVHAGLPALEGELLVYAWLNSVAGLTSPAPTLAQHVASMAPGTEFGVCVRPEARIKRLTKSDRSIATPRSHRPMCLAVAGDDPAGSAWIDDVIRAGLGSPPTRAVAATPFGSKWWGTSRVVEAVAYPIDIPVVARRIIGALVSSLCRWCERPIAADRCPFCGVAGTVGRGGAA